MKNKPRLSDGARRRDAAVDALPDAERQWLENFNKKSLSRMFLYCEKNNIDFATYCKERITGNKRCSICEKWKKIQLFYSAPTQSGRLCYCIECHLRDNGVRAAKRSAKVVLPTKEEIRRRMAESPPSQAPVTSVVANRIVGKRF